MIGSAEILSAIRELTNSKQIDRTELHGLLQDGIHAALAKKHGPTVQAEVEIDERNGKINIVLLKTVVDEVTDPGREISVDEARFEDPEFQPGDVMEIPVDFAEFGRSAVQAAKQRIIQRVREGERSKIRDEFTNRVGELLSGEVQQIERGKLVVMLNKFREAEAIIPYREQNHREHFHQGDPIRAVLKRVEETPKGPRLILSRGDPGFVQALFRLEVPEMQQNIVEIRAAAREVGTERVTRAGRRERAEWRAYRYRAVVLGPGALCQARPRAGARGPCPVRLGDPDDPGHRRRGPAFTRHRPQWTERPPRVRADRMEDRSLLQPGMDGAERQPGVCAVA